MWYAYTATASVPVQVDTLRSNHDTLLAVYRRGGNGFVSVACNDNVSAATTQSQVKFNATSGRTYYILVGTRRAQPNQNLTLRVRRQDTTTPTKPKPKTKPKTLQFQFVGPGPAGETLYYNPSGFNTGSFTVSVATDDPETGIARVDFPAELRTGAGVVADTQAPYERTYRWTNRTTFSGPLTITAYNGNDMRSGVNVWVQRDIARPPVRITAPAPRATVARGAAIEVNASDAGAGVAQVDVLHCPATTDDAACVIRGTLVGSDTTAPYSVPWTNPPAAGSYKLVARAVDNVGNLGFSAVVPVTVGEDTTPPTVPEVTATEDDPDLHFVPGDAGGPISSALVFDPTSDRTKTYTLRAATGDPESGIASVTFPWPFVGADRNDVVDTTDPYEVSGRVAAGAWPEGVHGPITATNGAGLRTESAPFYLVPDSAPPSVAFAAPAPATVAAGQAIRVEASDSVGRHQEGYSRLATIELRSCPGTSCAFGAGTSLGVVAPPPNQLTWTAEFAWPDGRPAVTYTLVARAVDNLGHAADSAPITVEATGSGARAAAAVGDAVAPVVTLTAPAAGSTLAGETSLVARATDRGGSGVAQVVFEVRAAGGEWTALGADRAAPYERRVDASGWTDGAYQLRAVATDGAGNATASAAVRVRVVNPRPAPDPAAESDPRSRRSD